MEKGQKTNGRNVVPFPGYNNPNHVRNHVEAGHDTKYQVCHSYWNPSSDLTPISKSRILRCLIIDRNKPCQQKANWNEQSKDKQEHHITDPFPINFHYPIDPSIWSFNSWFNSTAYSIGSSFANGSMNPMTIISVACSSLNPRLIK